MYKLKLGSGCNLEIAPAPVYLSNNKICRLRMFITSEVADNYTFEQ